jgi:hypothetical protein
MRSSGALWGNAQGPCLSCDSDERESERRDEGEFSQATRGRYKFFGLALGSSCFACGGAEPRRITFSAITFGNRKLSR